MRCRTCALLLLTYTLCYAAVLDRLDAGSGCPAGARCAPLSQCPSAALHELGGRSCASAARELSVCCSGDSSPAAFSTPFQRHRRAPPNPSSPPPPSPPAAKTAKAPATRPPAKTAPKPPATPAPPPSVAATSAPPTPPHTTPSGNGRPRSASSSQRACQEYRRFENRLSSFSALHRRKRAVLQTDVQRVVGGERARNAEFAYMVAIGYVRGNSNSNATDIQWGCGGSLISDRHVLTAAHCITDAQKQDMRPVVLRLGENHLSQGPQRPDDYAVESITLHPRYRPELKYFDLALLRTDRPVLFSPSVTPVCLATPETRVTPNTTLLAAGWGAIDPVGFEPSADLKKARLRFVVLEECQKQYLKSDNLPQGLDSSMLCAAEPNGEADTCKGDSGGPLAVRDRHGDVLVGVTSFGGRPCAGSKPGVYARVQTGLSWIESVVWS